MKATKACFWGVAAVLAHSAALAAEPSSLPLKRVRLYEVGVGYFERSGTVSGASDAVLPVPAGHLDDALKTLVVMSPGGNTAVAGVEFGTSVTADMARALAGLDGAQQSLGLVELIGSLEGADVELRTAKETVKGRVVDVQDRATSDMEECRAPKPDAPCVPRKVPSLVLLTKASELRRFAVHDVVAIKPTDPGRAKRLETALEAAGGGAASVEKKLRVMAQAGKPVALGYVAETPVWRSTYRLVLGSADDAVLQGWALLHNDTDEDWKKVGVELVNGRPDSFLFPLAAPRYARRELVTPENELSTVPQLLGTTPDAMWTGESYGAAGMGLTGIGSGGGGAGEGSIGLGSIGTIGHGAGAAAGPGQSSMLSVGNLAAVAPTEGVEAGALFRYKLASPLDLRAHGSALVPFVADKVSARRIAFLTAPGAAARSAVHLKNAGHQTLPPGPISIFADGGFSGESAIERLKPRESRILSFGFDLDLELSETDSKHTDETRLVTWTGGSLMEHFVRHHTIAYEIENRSGSGRTVYLELPFVNNAKVTGSDEIAYDEETKKGIAVFQVKAKHKGSRTLRVDEGLSQGHPADKLTSRELEGLAQSKLLPESQKKVLLAAADLLVQAEVRRGGIIRRTADLKQAESDIVRLRQNARAVDRLKGGDAIVKRLLAAEDRAKKLRQRLSELRSEIKERTRRAHRTLARLGPRR